MKPMFALCVCVHVYHLLSGLWWLGPTQNTIEVTTEISVCVQLNVIVLSYATVEPVEK